MKDEGLGSGPTSNRDNIAAFSPVQSPASQEAALSAIATTLREEHIDFAGIVATDALDSLFLSRFLRTSAPDIRLFTLDANLTFVREQTSTPLKGMLSITNYPIISLNQHWTDLMDRSERTQRRVQFSSRAAQGVYNATRRLLGAGLIEYGRPGQAYSEQPPLWLTVLGRDRYWPLALLDDPPDEGSSELVRSATTQNDAFHLDYPQRFWYICYWLLMLYAMLHAAHVTHLLKNKATGEEAKSAELESVGADSGKRRRSQQHALDHMSKIFSTYPEAEDLKGENAPQFRAFLLTTTLALATCIFLLGSPLWVSPRGTSWWAPAYSAITAAALLILFVTAFRLRVWRTWYGLFAATAWVMCLLLCGTWLMLLTMSRYKTGWFFAYRSLGLLSGVAPEAPFMLAVIALIYWSWVNLRREDWSANQRVIRKGRPAMPGWDQMEAIDLYIENVFTAEIWMPALAILFFWAYILEPWKNLRSVEYWPYGYAYVIAIGLVYWAMAVTMSQFLLCWKRFQRFLQWLETQPFRNGFSHLGPQLSRMALVYKLDGGPLSFSKRGLDCLDEIESLEAKTPRPVGQRHEVEGPASAQQSEPAVTKTRAISRLIGALEAMLLRRGQINWSKYLFEYATLQNALDERAREFIDELNGKVWANGSPESPRQERPQVQGPDRILFLKQKFIVIRYLIYIRYVIRHLRNLLWFLVVSFILSVLSLESYVFQGHRAIDITSILTFVALGIGIVIVLGAWDRDPTLSRIMETKPNEIGRDFYVQLVRYGALPLFTLLAAQFPSISRFLFSWLQPALEGVK